MSIHVIIFQTRKCKGVSTLQVREPTPLKMVNDDASFMNWSGQHFIKRAQKYKDPTLEPTLM